MAGTVQPVQIASDAGIVPATITAAAQNEAPVNARVILIVTTNSNSGGITVTLKDQVTVDGSAGPDKVVAVALSTTKIIGPVPAGVYGLADNNFEFDINTPANVSTLFIVEVP